MQTNDNRMWSGYEAGLEAWESCWTSTRQVPHWHDSFQVSLTIGGGGIVDLPGQVVRLSRGIGVIIPPRTVHRLTPDAGIEWRFHTVYLSMHQATSFGDLAPLELSCQARSMSIEMAELFLELHRQIKRDEPSDKQRRVLSQLARRMPEGDALVSTTPLTVEQTWLATIKRDLDSCLDREVKLVDLARLAGVDECHLVRVFRRTYGMPPHAYHVQRRVNRARELLRGGMAPAEVADAVGFSDQSHLTRHFTKLIGTPPGRYRVRSRMCKTD